MKELPNFESILFREDGLGITSCSARLQEKLRQKIMQIFAEHALKISIKIDLEKVDYLDVSLDLERGLYKPYRKLGDRPLYVSSQSNHPPLVLKNLPAGFERRLSENSANVEVFKEAIPAYQAELDRCGYSYKLKYTPSTETRNNSSK